MTALDLIRSRFNVSTDATSPVRLPAGRAELSRLLADLGSRNGAEIGVWRGKWSARLCLDNPDLELLCVDTWASYSGYQDSRNNAQKLEEAYANARERLSQYRCTILRQPSLEAAKSVPDGSLDFVYVDANHGETFVMADLKAWASKVRVGGIVAGHDYIWRPERPWIQVKSAVDRYVREHGIDPLFVCANEPASSFFWVQS